MIKAIPIMCWLFLCALSQIEGSAEILAGQSKLQRDLYGVSFLLQAHKRQNYVDCLWLAEDKVNCLRT